MNSITVLSAAMALSKEEKAFFAQLGARIAQLRKAQGITQTQLADILDVSQQTITAYEVGRRRIQVSSLNVIAAALGVAVEDLMGTPVSTSGKRGPAPKLQQQMDRIAKLPKSQQRFVMQVIESVLAQAGR
jgi:transcriptional regulator with XRE-family HTH domain